MSDARTAAIVCEGHTDVPILRTVIQKVWPEIENVLCLQPELDEIDRAKGPTGWSQVRAWCKAQADNLDEVLDPDLGDRIDLLVIAIDVDIAVAAGIVNPPRIVGPYEADRLRETMAGWLQPKGTKRLPGAVVLSTPVMAVEAWILAALFPREKTPESIRDPAAWLVRKGKLRPSPSDGKPWKELRLYQDEFQRKLGERFSKVRRVCAEADRTAREIERRRKDLGERRP